MEMLQQGTQIDHSRLERFGVKFRKNTKARSIFHYTSIGGLQGILSSKKLRFTNIKYMNDKDEIVAGLDSMVKAWGVPEEERERLRDAFLHHRAQTFICCFSLENDSLPLWNYYTKEINNQGYNIEFDDKKLVESILHSNPILDGCEFAFGEVDYSKDNDSVYSTIIANEVAKRIESSLSNVFLEFAKSNRERNPGLINDFTLSDLEQKAFNSEKRRNTLPIYFFNGETCSFEKDSSRDYLYFIKRDYFQQEREFRIVITVPDRLLAKMAEEKVYNFRVSNGVLVPYIELAFAEDVVKSVTISPTVQSDLVELSIQDFMTYCKYNISDYSQFIRHSKVPVRF